MGGRVKTWQLDRVAVRDQKPILDEYHRRAEVWPPEIGPDRGHIRGFKDGMPYWARCFGNFSVSLRLAILTSLGMLGVLLIMTACGKPTASKFEVQLAPLVKELKSDETAELRFVHGPVEAFPPEGFESFFGVGPYYRFIKPAEVERGGGDLLDRIRNFPKGATAEDQMRELLCGGDTGAESPLSMPDLDDVYGNDSAQQALNYLYQIIEEEGPFDGIIGYSEGATVAATLILHEQKRYEIEGREPTIKCALFFGGWPPLNAELNRIVLADESDLTITIPTCHVIGSLDPYLAGSIALYNVCDLDNAYLFDHAKGHTLPRDKHTVKELGDIIRNMVANI